MPLNVTVFENALEVKAINQVVNLNYGKYSQKGADGLGASNFVFNYRHIQSSPNTIWTFAHNLNRNIVVAKVVDSAGKTWHALEITNIDLNNCSVNVGNAPFSGELFAM